MSITDADDFDIPWVLSPSPESPAQVAQCARHERERDPRCEMTPRNVE